MRDRVEYYFRDVRGFAYDEVRACMAAGWTDLIDLEARLKRVQAIRPTPDFEPIAASFKRIKNILKQAEFKHRRRQTSSYLGTGPRTRSVRRIRAHRQPAARISASRPLRPKMDLFFDKVLVNAPDPDVRKTVSHYCTTCSPEFLENR